MVCSEKYSLPLLVHRKPEMLLCKLLSLLQAVLLGNVYTVYHNSTLTFHSDPAQKKGVILKMTEPARREPA